METFQLITQLDAHAGHAWMGLVIMGKVEDSPALLLLAGKQKGSPDPFQYPEP